MSEIATNAPAPAFRVDMLWTDSRYRSRFFQVIAFVVFIAAIFWLATNAKTNLETLGKDFGFVFMTQPSSYDINQVLLVDYTSRSSHSTAAIVGILNTLLIAFFGCIAATIVGVLAGVARLSKNWVIARLMTVYIEGVRNIPVLLQILLWYAIFIETLPQPRAFKGDTATASMVFGDAVAATNRGFYLPGPVFVEGSFWLVLVFILSVVGIVLFGRWTTEYQRRTGDMVPPQLRAAPMLLAPVLAAVVTFLVWSTGLLVFDIFGGADGAEAARFLGLEMTLDGAVVHVALFALLCFVFSRLSETAAIRTAILIVPVTLAFGLLALIYGTNPMVWDFPTLKGFNFDGGIHARNSFVALWFALSLYTGAFIAENVRAGIMAVAKGQTEAAFALGLRPKRTMNLIILPQALRVIIPPLISQYLNLTKNSSLAIAVGYMDVTATLGGITLNQTGKEMQTILLLMAFYLSISLTISFVMNLYNENVKLVERTSSYGFGLSFANLFKGPWDNMRKGDAKMREDYGVWGWMIPIALFYAFWLGIMLHYVFIEDLSERASYFTWTTYNQLIALLMIAMAGGVLSTIMLKGSRFIDLAVVEFIVFLCAVAAAPLQRLWDSLAWIFTGSEFGRADVFPFGDVMPEIGFLQGLSWVPEASAVFVIVTGAAIRIAIIAYAGLGTRPNVTYLNRIREGRA